ncbi:gamma-aminobutyric acid type B receptor subunit 2-like [Lineus longissimus]|uniref:gamma-aminobutyric acid type B receptor subunit 2-like n=1 Tax=Lineus longissimus TaxID=88925 RepID=UPI00315DBC05
MSKHSFFTTLLGFIIRTCITAWILLCSQKTTSLASIYSKDSLYIAGFFPMTSTPDGLNEEKLGRGVQPAWELALEDVNADDNILKDYKLEMRWNDTKCDMAYGTKQFFNLMHNIPPKVMLFGPACSGVTGPIAEMSRWWNIRQLSYADTNPELNDRTKYPNLFRTVPSENDFNPARLSLLQTFHWSRVATLYQDASTKGSGRFAYAHNALTKLLDENGINATTKGFTSDPAPVLKQFQKQDMRIFIGNFDETMARRVFCEAYKLSLFGPKHVWMVLGWWKDDWWKVQDVDCTLGQMMEAIDGYFATDILQLSTSPLKTIAGKTASGYKKRYDRRRGEEYSKYHGYAYDGIWVIAKALDTIIRQQDGNSTLEDDLRTVIIHQALNETDFRGVTGQIQFLNGDRLGEIAVLQFQGDSKNLQGVMKKVGEFHAITKRLFLYESSPIKWRGNQPPLDRLYMDEELERVQLPIYIILGILSGLGIIFAICLIYVNVRFRKHRYIKMSSPQMNNLIIVGCILSYFSVFLLGVDGGLVHPDLFPIICVARSWILAIGFTFSFGAMFSKTWRVHAIFTNIKMNKKVIKDYKLMLMVCVLLLLDLSILVAWQIVDPLRRKTKKMPLRILTPDGDRAVVPLLEYCHSQYMTVWMGAIYAYKGLLLVFGCFLAWETRHVSIPALNDSKYIGMSVYNTVIMCIAGAAVSVVIQNQLNASFTIIGLFIIFCTSITLCLVFLPKLIQIRKDPKGEERRLRATIKKVSKKDSNTFNDLHQNIRNLTDESIRLKKVLEEKMRILQELMEQLGEDALVDGVDGRSPMHKSVMALKTANNTSPAHQYHISQGSLYPEDTDSMFSSSSVTNLWPVDSSSPHRLYISSRERTSSIITENIEMSEIGKKPSSLSSRSSDKDAMKRYSKVYFDLDTSDEDPVMESTPLKDRAIAMICNSSRTPSYTGLKYLADPTLRETAILHDSDTCSYHSLPGLLILIHPQEKFGFISNVTLGFFLLHETCNLASADNV